MTTKMVRARSRMGDRVRDRRRHGSFSQTSYASSPVTEHWFGNLVLKHFRLAMSSLQTWEADGTDPDSPPFPTQPLPIAYPHLLALHWTHQPDTATSIVSALATVALTAFLALGTNQIALRTSQVVGGLLNASLEDIVELIIVGIALGRCDLGLVQGSLLGGLYGFHRCVIRVYFSHLTCAPPPTFLFLLPSPSSFLSPAAFREWSDGRIDSDLGAPYLLQLSRNTSFTLHASSSNSIPTITSSSTSCSRSGFETVHEPIPGHLASADVLPITTQDI
ncbi:hypothetical protein BDM02DRAFT_1850515 [Thelephora ganbajun]|uniref:Uncharacterized protein n=1 Tax=Thelephora ganbajun TaxID=370292 RepID=A0ACB6ZJ55_THEGA|nr:hypothetical protein BDM02DRAFT_1850515 [Thelephora ganbajun]